MDYTKLMEITGMTMNDIKEIPKKALYNIVATLEKSLLENYFTTRKRAEIDYQIACYNELMLTAK